LLGLFTRTACIVGAGYLLMFYLAMPSLPWLPDNPRSEGHYLFINKNIIEMIALLRSEEHTSELQSHLNIVCRLLLEKKKQQKNRRRRRRPPASEPSARAPIPAATATVQPHPDPPATQLTPQAYAAGPQAETSRARRA